MKYRNAGWPASGALRLATQAERHALVADDDEDTRTLLATFLRRAGFAVAEARDGEQLLDVFGTLWPDGPTQSLVVVSDIGMPVRDGLQATRMLRALAPSLPVILVTAFSDAATLQAARDAGAASVMLKPIDRAGFVETALRLVEPTSISEDERARSKS